jgi:hypothetical protein
MKDALKSKVNSDRWLGTAPLLLVSVWVAVIAGFLFQLARAGLSGQ